MTELVSNTAYWRPVGADGHASRRMCIPSLGDKLVLARPWTFTVVNDRRNRSLAVYLNLLNADAVDDDYAAPFGGTPGRRWIPADVTAQATLPAGTTLSVARIYIRLGQKAYDSVTFVAPGLTTRIRTGLMKKTVRFFASLADVNRMEIVEAED